MNKNLNKIFKATLFSISLLTIGIFSATNVQALEILATNYSMNATLSKMTAQELCTTAGLVSTDPTAGVTWGCTSANLDTTKAGRYSINIKASDSSDSVLKTIQVKVNAVEVNTAPVITLKNSTVTIYKGDSIDLSSYVASATDKEDGNITPVISGSVNTNKTGVYSVTYSVTDSQKLTSSAKLIVKVIVKGTGSDDSAQITVNNTQEEQSSTTVSTSVEDGTELPSTSDVSTMIMEGLLIAGAIFGVVVLKKKRELID